MPITAADVHATQFRVVFRGYEIRSVDAFLDEVEHELERLAATDTGPGERSGRLVAAQPHALATAVAGPRPVLPDLAPAAEADGRGVSTGPGEVDVPAHAIRTLRLAEQMADQVVASAVAEADQIQAEAADEVARLSDQARELAAEVERLRALDAQIRNRVESLLHAQLELVRGNGR